jgi:hypothetical protein
MSDKFTIDENGNRVPYTGKVESEGDGSFIKRVVGRTAESLGTSAQGIARGLNALYQGTAPLERPIGTGFREWGKKLAEEEAVTPATRAAHPYLAKAGDIAENLIASTAPLAAGLVSAPVGLPAFALSMAGGQFERSYESAKAQGMPESEAIKAATAPAAVSGLGALAMGPVAKYAEGLAPAAKTAAEILNPSFKGMAQRAGANILANTGVMQAASAATVGTEALSGARPEADAMKEVWANPEAWLESALTAGVFKGVSGVNKAMELRKLRNILGNPNAPEAARWSAAENVQRALQEAKSPEAESFGAMALDAIINKKAIPVDLAKSRGKIISALEEKIANPDIDLAAKVDTKLSTPEATPAELNEQLTFSVSKGIDPAADASNTTAAMQELRAAGVEFKRVQGVYDGMGKDSFVVMNTPENRAKVQKLAQKFNQESIMHTDNEGNAKYIFANGEEKSIGQIHEISAAEAVGKNHTFDPESGKYYSTKEAPNATEIRTGEQGTELQRAGAVDEREGTYREQPKTEIQRSGEEANNSNRPIERTGKEVTASAERTGLSPDDVAMFDAKTKAQVEKDIAMTQNLNPERAVLLQAYHDERFPKVAPQVKVEAAAQEPIVDAPPVTATDKVLPKGKAIPEGGFVQVAENMAVIRKDGTLKLMDRSQAVLATAEMVKGKLTVDYMDEMTLEARAFVDRAFAKAEGMPSKKFAVEENASGESEASLEAIRRAGNEPPRLRFDARSGKGGILRGVEAADFQPGAYDLVIQRIGANGEMAVVSQGEKVTGAMVDRVLSKYRAAMEDMLGKQESTPEAGIALSNPSKKVIGLDIDGVFNTNAEGGRNIDPSRVIEFNKILNRNGNPDVVLGSTWRESALLKNDIAEAQAVIDSLGIKARVVGVTPDLGGDTNAASRGSEYKAWMDTYGKKFGSDLVAVLDDRVDLTELGNKHIKTEGGLSAENLKALEQAISGTTPTLTKEIIQKAYPKSQITETPEGFKLKTPGGADMLFREQSVIIMTPRERIAAESAYGRELKPTEMPVAAAELGLNTIMSFTPNGVKNIDHEKWHWAEYSVLTRHEIDIVAKKYATEEARADAYQAYIDKISGNPKYRPKNVIEVYWQKIVDFFQNIKNTFMMTDENIFKKLASGEMEERYSMYGKYTKESMEMFGSLGKPAPKYAIQDMAKSVMESKFVDDDVKPKVINTIKNVRETIDQAGRAFAPGARSEAAFQTQAEFRQVLGEMWNKQLQSATKIDKIMKGIKGEVSTVTSVMDLVRSQGKTLADTYFAKMPVGEQHDFMARMDSGKPQIDAPRQQIADFMKEMFDARVETIQQLGTGLLTDIRTGEGENPYFPRYWERADDAMRDISTAISKRPLDTRKSFAEKRVFGDIYEGIEAGHKLVSNNPMDLFFMKVGEMDRYIAAHKMLQSLESDGLARLVPAGEGMEPGELNILGTYGTVKRADVDANGVQLLDSFKSYKYAVREDVAQVINNYLSQNLYNNKYIGKAFSGYMALANNLNQMQLGVGSMFHAGFTSLEAIISHGALGLKAIANGDFASGVKYLAEAPAEFIRNPMIGGKVLAAMADPTSAGITHGMDIPMIAENAVLAGARKGMDTRFQTHTTEKMFEAWANGNKIGAAVRAPFAMIEQMARPLMEWLVPRQKFGVFADMSSFWMNEHPNASFKERREAMQEIWNRVDSRLGQVVYDRLFVNNVAKNMVQGALRAPGWTGGTILELVGGAKDVADLIRNVAKGEKPNMSDRTAYTLSLLLTTAVANGALTALFTGEAPEGRDFIAFRTGNVDERGFEERFMLPTYMKDVLAYSEAPGTTLLHKLHPALGMGRDIIQNKDYYGTEIRHEGDNIVAQASQLVGFTAKQYMPFWIRGMQKEAERGGTALAMGAPFIGIMPAPSDLNRTPAEKMIRKFVTERMPKTTKTAVEFERSKMLTKLTSEFRMQNVDAENDLHEAVAAGIISTVAAKRIKSEAKLSPLASGFKRLSLDEARKVMEKATPAERILLEKILKTKEAHFKKLYPNAEQPE